jgi:hypothetical protein
MDLQQALFQALKYGGAGHFLTTFLVERWRKNNHMKPDGAGHLAYPTSTSDVGDAHFHSDETHQAGLAYTLYSLDSSLGSDVALSVAAALLTPSSAAAGASTPSAAALPGGSGAAVPIAAALGGYILGQNFA